MRICLAHNHVTDQGLPIQHIVYYEALIKVKIDIIKESLVLK